MSCLPPEARGDEDVTPFPPFPYTEFPREAQDRQVGLPCPPPPTSPLPVGKGWCRECMAGWLPVEGGSSEVHCEIRNGLTQTAGQAPGGQWTDGGRWGCGRGQRSCRRAWGIAEPLTLSGCTPQLESTPVRTGEDPTDLSANPGGFRGQGFPARPLFLL